TREAELAMTPFNEHQKTLFIQQQFSAQTQHYQSHYCSDHFCIIEIDGRPSGRVFIVYWSDEIRIVVIANHPVKQDSGAGSYLLQNIIEEGNEKGLPVRIHVEQNNPAKKLYERLGFKEVSRFNEVYVLMETTPALMSV
ncbi:MAG: GNAT family N-acetyltransferase, partial [Pseudomonadota bacterium]|nr:GNAT family N-acetyltransferase [Pseudomonadota bacterium]